MGNDRGACGRPDRRFRAGADSVAALVGALFAAPTRSRPIYTVNSAATPTDGVCDVLDCTLRDAIDAANATAGPDTSTSRSASAAPSRSRPFAPLPHITDAVTIDGTTQTGLRRRAADRRSTARRGSGAPGLSVAARRRDDPGARGHALRRHGIVLEARRRRAASSGATTSASDSDGDVAQRERDRRRVLSAGNTIGGTTRRRSQRHLGQHAARHRRRGRRRQHDRGQLHRHRRVRQRRRAELHRRRRRLRRQHDRRIGDAERHLGQQRRRRRRSPGEQQRRLRATTSAPNADGDTAVPNGSAASRSSAGRRRERRTTVDGATSSPATATRRLIIAARCPDSAQATTICGNFIGTTRTGRQPLGNSGPGIAIASGQRHRQQHDRRLAATPSEHDRVQPKGISLGTDTSQNSSSATRSTTTRSLGIDLDDDGVTPNDPGDGDTGANELMNFPVLDRRRRSTRTGRSRVTGTYDGSLAERALPARLLREPGLRRQRQRRGDDLARNGHVASPTSAGDVDVQHGQRSSRTSPPDSASRRPRPTTTATRPSSRRASAVPPRPAPRSRSHDRRQHRRHLRRRRLHPARGDRRGERDRRAPTRSTFNLPAVADDQRRRRRRCRRSRDDVVIDGTTQPGFDAGQADGADRRRGRTTQGDRPRRHGRARRQHDPRASRSPASAARASTSTARRRSSRATTSASRPTARAGRTAPAASTRAASRSAPEATAIGGTTAATRNVISGNDGAGDRVHATSRATS